MDNAYGSWVDAEDPLFVSDPHTHDLTLGQAELLHRRLGAILAATGAQS